MKYTVSYTIHGQIDVKADTKENAAKRVCQMPFKKLQKKSLTHMVSADYKDVEEVKDAD